MGFSTSAKFNLDLANKNNSFVAPQFEILVAGRKLAPTDFHISGCTVTIPVTVGDDEPAIQSGDCSFALEGMFDLKTSKLLGDLENKLAVGKTVEVKGGYKTLKRLFLGSIKSVDISYQEVNQVTGQQGGVHVDVVAMDALEALRAGQQIHTFNKEAPSKTVRDIVKDAIKGSPAKGTIGTIDTLTAFNVQLVQEGMDDISLLQMLSRRFGKTLACVHGQIVFTDMLTKTTSMGTLTYGKNLLRFHKEMDSSGLFGTVRVNGMTAQGTAIMGTAASVTVGGTGKTAKQFDTDVAARIHEEEDGIATTQAELTKLAQNMLNENNIRFVSCQGATIGIPEMIPGRYMTVAGMSPKTNGNYFITKVTHSFGPEGYTTSFECKGAKSK